MIRKGDKITFKPEWRDAEDGENSHIALEDEADGRVLVTPVRDARLRFPPSSRVRVDMVESARS